MTEYRSDELEVLRADASSMLRTVATPREPRSPDRWHVLFLSISLATNFLFLQWLILEQTVSLQSFFGLAGPNYAWTSVLLTLLSSIFLGAAAGRLMLLDKESAGALHWLGLLIGAGLVLAATGCPTCGPSIAEVLGIRGGLVEFPLQGLEIKALGGLILTATYWLSMRNASQGVLQDAEPVVREPFFPRLNRGLAFPLLLILSIGSFYTLPRVPDSLKLEIAPARSVVPRTARVAPSGKGTDLTPQLEFPEQPYTLSVTYGDIGPALIENGIIDFDRFVQLYQDAGHPLTAEQREILQSGSDQVISIDQDNAYFLLNFLWAFGLSNRNPILESGSIAQGETSRYASTAGWTLGTAPGPELLSAFEIVTLAPSQPELVDRVAGRIYRPCCNNPTAFPDCNHGMAMLGLLELMAAQGASETELFEAAKQFNGFWFPRHMQHVATFFEATEGWAFNDIPGEIASGPAVFSGSGHQNLMTWMNELGLLDRSNGGGASCGV